MNRVISATRPFADCFASAPEDLDDLLRLIQRRFQGVGDAWRDERSPGPDADLETLRAELQALELLPEDGADSAALDGEADRIARQCIDLRSPRVAAHLHCPPLRASVAADALVALLNPSMDSWDQSGMASLAESRTIEELGRLAFGAAMAPQSDGVFTSGGTQSNLMGLMLARESAFLQREECSVFRDGLPPSASKYRVLCSDNAHFSALKSAAMLGLGSSALAPVACDERGRMRAAALRQKLEEIEQQGERALCVFATAGTTDHGAIDELSGIADLCEARNLWLHVDAAYGGALLATRRRRRLRGIERAHSISMDFHKMFFQPIACGAFLVRDRAAFALIRYNADYLNREDDVFPNLVDKSLATTRRFDALKLWLSLRFLGRARFEAMVDSLLDLTRFAAESLKSRSDFELLCEPELSTVLFRCVPVLPGNADQLNSAVRMRLLVSGQAVIGETRIAGRAVLKLTLLNPSAGREDIDQLLDLISATARNLQQTAASAGVRNEHQ